MKTLFKTLLATMIVVAGCQSIDLSMVHEIQNQDNAASLISSSMKVTTDLVETYLKGFKGVVATRVSDVTVDPVMNGSDTVMYLVNYPEGGWELLSADKRIPTRLMVGETGSMTIDQIEEHPGMSILLDDMRKQISTVKQSKQTEPVTEKGVLWNYIASDIPETKSGDILWNLYNTEVVYLDSTDVRHLTKTHWGQSSNGVGRWFNRFVPYKNSSKINNSDGRCVVGCAPVAAGQMLVYLLTKIGVTTNCTFSECMCESYIPDGDTSVGYGENFIPNVSTYMSYGTYWNYVRGITGTIEEQDKTISVLLSRLGYLMKATYRYYWDNEKNKYVKETSVYPDKFEEVFEEEYDISCECIDWNTGVVSSQISVDKMPVIVFAYNETGAGHSWIVDGYYHMCTVVNYHYVGIDPSTHQPVYKTIQSLGDCEEFFTMNWGWFGSGDNGQYYVDSSTWKVNDKQLPLRYNRQIVYGFSRN